MTRRRTDLLQDTRERLLDAVADAARQLDPERRRPNRHGARKEAHSMREEAGDFLEDAVHLNIQYLNQWARLGSSYAVLAGRALEKLYDYLGAEQQGPEDDAASDHDESEAGEMCSENALVVTGVAGETRVVKVLLQSSRARSTEGRLLITPIESEGKHPPLQIRPSDVFDDDRLELLPREKLEAELLASFSDAMNIGVGYRFEVRFARERGGGEHPEPECVCVAPAALVLKRVAR